ncbi:tyrosine-type recombinase/integrase [Burkholderia sp. WAC0059]|uniref:tyrosine-type recombinase/integrase n=1 Tax=Burkholderia sp. WAC0059 TaxID=2066022 RepID=UPI0021551E3B|nr:tyrosine-type recombinase/integrase [Burkholderia sp. WAC0059]
MVVSENRSSTYRFKTTAAALITDHRHSPSVAEHMGPCGPGKGTQADRRAAECRCNSHGTLADMGKHPTRVFTRDGEADPYFDSKQWNAACKRVGIRHFRFHDVRHTWASWHVQGGTPLNRLMELGGWASYEMVLRYAHLAPEHLSVHADAVPLDRVDTAHGVTLAVV